MRTQRRPLALAATLATALLGIGLVAGAQPAAATDTNAASCAASSTDSTGGLDGAQLQACILDSVHSELGIEAPAEDAPIVQEFVEVTYAEASPYDALDAVFAVDVPLLDQASAEPAALEAAPIDSGLGGDFAALRDCESGGDYGIDTGNGYYGAYQFALSTWQGLGYGGYPHEASPAVQDQAAQELQTLYGWSQWPGCSWYLGLG